MNMGTRDVQGPLKVVHVVPHTVHDEIMWN